MDVSDEILKSLQAAVVDRFGDGPMKVSIKAVEIDEVRKTIRFELRVETLDDPSAFAKKLYGFTAIVRDLLPNEWRKLFPVITPVVGPARIQRRPAARRPGAAGAYGDPGGIPPWRGDAFGVQRCRGAWPRHR